MNQPNKNLRILGIILALSAVLLAISFELFTNHMWFWNSAYIFIALITLSSILGAFFVAKLARQNPAGHKRLRLVGGIFTVILSVIMLMSITLAFLGINYFSSNYDYISWDSYQGDYIVGSYAIRLFQIGVISGLLGGIIISLKPKGSSQTKTSFTN